MDFLLSGMAACGACVFTNPLEVVKTRMQLQGELKAPGTYQRHYRNVFHAFFTIGKVDGLAALQKGLGPALLYQFLMNGIRLGTYGLAERKGYLSTDEGVLSPVRSAAAGALAGVIGAYLGSPIYLVRRESCLGPSRRTLGVRWEPALHKGIGDRVLSPCKQKSQESFKAFNLPYTHPPN